MRATDPKGRKNCELRTEGAAALKRMGYQNGEFKRTATNDECIGLLEHNIIPPRFIGKLVKAKQAATSTTPNSTKRSG